MPLIDGTYEILRQQPLSETETLVQATDPDGRPVRIVLYDVPAEREAAFERHRRRLRALGREPYVLLRDVVSRPGAHYAVWEDPPDAPATEADPAWRERLAAVGVDPADALLRREGRRIVLGLVLWSGPAAPAAAPVAPAAPASDGAAARPNALARAWERFGGLGPRARTWLLSALLSLGAVALFLVGWARDDNDALVVVPDVAGLPAQEAATRLRDARLGVVPQPRADGEAAGTALGTVPPAGATLRPAREVQLVYALPEAGMATQEVPGLVGRSVGEELAARLREAELTLGDVARVPADLPPGTVLAQRPAAGGHAPRGAEVALLVSDGPRPERTLLPDLVGLEEDEARELARLAGFPAERVLADEVAAPDAEPGTVVGMTPAPWWPVRLDDVTVRLLVAGAAEGAPRAAGGAPDLVGLPSDEALAAARGAGLAPSVERLVDPRLPSGVVLQEPAPGEAGDGTLRLVVNARPVPLPRPEPVARELTPSPREVPYRFLIEPGIPQQSVEVRAVTADGRDVLVDRTRAAGGEVVEGTWATRTPGPIRFEVYLNGVFYAEVRVSP